MSTPLTTHEELLDALSGFFLHPTSRFELLPAAPDTFIDYPAAILVQAYETLWRGWQPTIVPVSEELYASISLEKGTLQELIELVTKQTRAHKLSVLSNLLAA